MNLAPSVDDALEQCEIRCAFDNALRITIAGTSKVSMFWKTYKWARLSWATPLPCARDG